MEFKTVAERLMSLRRKRALSQKNAAEGIGITQSTLSKYERAELEPGASVLRLIADFYGVSSDYILGRAAEKPDAELVQAASAYTGLSEEALEKLRYLQKDVTAEFLSALILNDNFADMLEYIYSLHSLSFILLDMPCNSQDEKTNAFMMDTSVDAWNTKADRAYHRLIENMDERVQNPEAYAEMNKKNGGADNGKRDGT